MQATAPIVDDAHPMPQPPSPKRAHADDGIDIRNIVSGKRHRKSTTRLVDSTQWQHDYQQLILDDVPANEINAALLDEELDDDEGSDNEGEGQDEGVSSDDDDDVSDFIVDDSDNEDSDRDDEYIVVGTSDSDSDCDE